MKGKHISKNAQRKLRSFQNKKIEDMSIKELVVEAENGNIAAKLHLLKICNFNYE